MSLTQTIKAGRGQSRHERLPSDLAALDSFSPEH
jgi:hypothetical protein